jgi:hypothetical protein
LAGAALAGAAEGDFGGVAAAILAGAELFGVAGFVGLARDDVASAAAGATVRVGVAAGRGVAARGAGVGTPGRGAGIAGIAARAGAPDFAAELDFGSANLTGLPLDVAGAFDEVDDFVCAAGSFKWPGAADTTFAIVKYLYYSLARVILARPNFGLYTRRSSLKFRPVSANLDKISAVFVRGYP